MDVTVAIDYSTSVRTNANVAKGYAAWKTIHEYGPYTIRLVPTGIGTAVIIKHDKTGHEFDLTDYDSF